MTILIVGATGHLGRATALALLSEGQRVRALVREPARAPRVVSELQRAGAELVVGDLTDAASLEAACKGALAVFACAHAMLGRGAKSSAQVDHVGHSSLLAAALATGVPRFVYTSALGAREDHPIDFFRTKWEIEQAVRDSGVPHTVLRPAAFMEQHVHEFLGRLILDKGFAVLFGDGRKPRNFVAVRDVVPFATMALSGDMLLGRTLDIGGPEDLSTLDVANLYIIRSHQGRVIHLPAGLARAGAPLVRPFHEGIARVLEIASVPEQDWPETFDPSALQAEFPRTMTTVEKFVDERVRDWRRSRVGRR